MQIFQPLLGLIFSILGLYAGFPCKKNNSPEGNCSTGSLNVNPITFSCDEDDASCCDEDTCPPILSDRSLAPSGFARVKKAKFGHCKPRFVFKIDTGNPTVAELEKYHSSPRALDCLIDKKVNKHIPAGSASPDRSTFKIEIRSIERGVTRSIIASTLDIDGETIFVSSSLAKQFKDKFVFYKVIPDYDMLFAEGIISIGCHPDIADVKDPISKKLSFDPVPEANPEVANINNDYNAVLGGLNGINIKIRNTINNIGDIPDVTTTTNALNDLQDEAIDLLSNFASSLLNSLNAVLSRNIDPTASSFDVDKNVVKANGKDFATITIIPRDVTGALIARNLPNGAEVNVEIINSLGNVSDQILDGPRGIITAKLKSAVIGISEIRVKVNNIFIDILDDSNIPNVQIEKVRFISEADLPIRRRRTKPSGKPAIKTGSTSEKEPGVS